MGFIHVSPLVFFSPSFHSPTISLCWVLMGFSLNPLVPLHPVGDGVVVVVVVIGFFLS
jgi:hypothetical protein